MDLRPPNFEINPLMRPMYIIHRSLTYVNVFANTYHLKNHVLALLCNNIQCTTLYKLNSIVTRIILNHRL